MHDFEVRDVITKTELVQLKESMSQQQSTCWTQIGANTVHLVTFQKTMVGVAFILENLMKAGLGTLVELHHIMVYLLAKDRRPRDTWEYLALTYVTHNWKDQMLECIDYAYEGRRQEIVEMLEGSATRMHRTIVVRGKRGSQNGSRSWGEIARSHIGKVIRMTH